MRLRAAAVGVALAFGVVACGGSDTAAPGFEPGAITEATYSYTIPLGTGAAIDDGEPIAILPGTLDARVGEVIEIINDDDRGHAVGPWFVGAGETVRQTFSTPGEFTGSCTVHPSGELVLRVT